MGYDLHITRACDWTHNIGAKISAEEWLAVVATDPELRPDESYGPYAATWVAARPRQKGWFDWYDGNIYTTNPDRPTVRKMLAIAHALSALVQGDEGEMYENERDWSARE
jgi:hypothetical protein